MIVRKKRQTHRLVGGDKPGKSTIGKGSKFKHHAEQVGKVVGYGTAATVLSPVAAAVGAVGAVGVAAYGAVAAPIAIAGVVGKSLVHGARAAGTGSVGLYQKVRKYTARSTLENQMGTRYTQSEILEKSKKHQNTIATLKEQKDKLTNITNKKAIQKIDQQLKKAQHYQSLFETKQLTGISSKSKSTATGVAATVSAATGPAATGVVPAATGVVPAASTSTESFNNKIKRLYNARKTEHNADEKAKLKKNSKRILSKQTSRKANLNQRQTNFDNLQGKLTTKEKEILSAKDAASTLLTNWKAETDKTEKDKLEKKLDTQTLSVKTLEKQSKNLRAQTIQAEKNKVEAQGRVTNSELQLQKRNAKLAKKQVTGSENSLARRSERLNLTKKKLDRIGKDLKANLTKTGSNLIHGRVLSLLGNITTRPLSSTGSAIKSAASSIYYAPKNLYKKISKSTAGNSLSLNVGKTANIVERAKGYKEQLANFKTQKQRQDAIIINTTATPENKRAAQLALKTINEKIENLSGRVNKFTTSLETRSTTTAKEKLKTDLTTLTDNKKFKAYSKANPNNVVVTYANDYYTDDKINLEKVNKDIAILTDKYKDGKTFFKSDFILKQYKVLAGLRKLATSEAPITNEIAATKKLDEVARAERARRAAAEVKV